MLSGIGNADELKNLGIPVVCHLPGNFLISFNLISFHGCISKTIKLTMKFSCLDHFSVQNNVFLSHFLSLLPLFTPPPGVGQNLQDHLEVYVQQKCTKPITLYNAQKPVKMVKIGLEWLWKFTGKKPIMQLFYH